MCTATTSARTRLDDQATTLQRAAARGTAYPARSRLLEAGCGLGAQTVTLAQRNPSAHITSIDLSAESVAQAKQRIEQAGLGHIEFQRRHPCPAFRAGGP